MLMEAMQGRKIGHLANPRKVSPPRLRLELFCSGAICNAQSVYHVEGSIFDGYLRQKAFSSSQEFYTTH